MHPKVVIYYSCQDGDGTKIFTDLIAAVDLVTEKLHWPIYLDIAFEPKLASNIFPDLSRLPNLPYISKSLANASMPPSCEFFDGLLARSGSLEAYPLKTFFSQNLVTEEQVISCNFSKETETNKTEILLDEKSILDEEISNYEFTVRTTNVFNRMKIETIGDLVKYSEAQFLREPNFGRKSLRETEDFLSSLNLHLGMEASALLKAKQNFAAPKHEQDANSDIAFLSDEKNQTESMIDIFFEACSDLNYRERDIIFSRAGVNGRPKTLEELGSLHDVTRERVRQIEAKTVRKLKHPSRLINPRGLWDNLLESYFTKASQPLTLDFLSSVNQQFNHEVNHRSVFIFLLQNFFRRKYYMVEFAGSSYIARVKQDELQKTLQGVASVLSGCVGKPILDCRFLAKSVVPPELEEFSSAIVSHKLEHCVIAEIEGDEVLQVFAERRSALVVAQEIIRKSQKPLKMTKSLKF